jgi:hypothetical protein
MSNFLLGGYFGLVLGYLGVSYTEPRFWIMIIIFAILVGLQQPD